MHACVTVDVDVIKFIKWSSISNNDYHNNKSSIISVFVPYITNVILLIYDHNYHNKSCIYNYYMIVTVELNNNFVVFYSFILSI